MRRCMGGTPMLRKGSRVDSWSISLDDSAMPHADLVPLANGLWIAFVVVTALALAVTFLPARQSALKEKLCRAPWLDVVIGSLTIFPWIIALILGGWLALAGTILGQLAALSVWTSIHELVYRELM